MNKLHVVDSFTVMCPHCRDLLVVYHMEWNAIVCIHCKKEVYQ